MSETQHIDAVEIADLHEEVDGTGKTRWVAKVDILADGRLVITQAEPERAAYLNRVIDRLNGQATVGLHADAPPAERYAVSTAAVERDDPMFVPALQSHLSRYYGLRLV
jgi:hypothetical protein